MKKKVVRKLMALALVSAMATSMLAGCGSSDDSGKDSGKDADKGSEETVLNVAAFEGGTELRSGKISRKHLKSLMME